MTSPSCKALSKKYIQDIPHQPGVYIMRDAEKTILYVGKARDLRKRVSSYRKVSSAVAHNKTRALLSHISTIKTILTATEKEALLLEASLIKKHRPKYNIILRDDKNYPYIKVTIQEQWPRLMMTRRRQKDGAQYFGPFSSSSSMWGTIDHLKKLFPLRNCKGGTLKKRKRPCLNFQMGRCLAPCTGQADPKEYKEIINNILLVLDGHNKKLFTALEMDMSSAAEQLDFEKAAMCRDRITALKNTLEKQVVVSEHQMNQDIFGFHNQGLATGISVLQIQHGVVSAHHSYYIGNAVGNDNEILSEVLQRFYENNRIIPDEILLPFILVNQDSLQELLTELKGKKISLTVPRRGDKAKLLQMAENNARQSLTEKMDKDKSWQKLAETIRQNLHLTDFPERIECLDISNFSGQVAVGSLVSFFQGSEEKKKYRHYRISTIMGPDDYGMMREVLRRRFSKKDGDWPNLLLLDGGKGQLNVAIEVLKELGVSNGPDLCSIAKEKLDEGEKLYRPGRKKTIKFTKHSPVLLYMMRIRDEAHRFGITTHRNWRRKKTLTSELDNIQGVGPAKRNMLLQELGSVSAIKQASAQKIATVQGISLGLAENIYNYFEGSM